MISILKESSFRTGRTSFNAKVAHLQESFMGSVIELRKSVDEIMAKYADLDKKGEITKALVDLSASSKTKQKLGPSKEILDATKQLKDFEQSVKSETVETGYKKGVDTVLAWLNGKGPHRMVFDTGASFTTISSKLASEIGQRPKPGDENIELETADKTKVIVKKIIIPSIKVGKITVKNVECAVMPAEKGDVPSLLGQSFLEHVKYAKESGHLVLKKLETAQDDLQTAIEDDPKAAAKTKPSGRQPTTTAKNKRSSRSTRGRPVSPDGAQDAGLDARVDVSQDPN
jgi:clan AA aspartic protease (TIGR02281 family)